MDDLDLRLIGAMFIDKIWSPTGIDPRRSTTELARTANASRLTVRRRLELWREAGVWLGLAVYPNPEYLGCAFEMQGFHLELGESRSQPEFERRARELVPALLSFQTNDVWVYVMLRSLSESDTQSWTKELTAIPGVRALCDPYRITFPSPKGALRRSDWRILDALRERPEADLAVIAPAVEMTPRGLRRRLSQLIDHHQLFFYPSIDLTRSEGTVLYVGVLLAKDADPIAVRQAVVQRYPELHEIEDLFPLSIFLPPEVRALVSGDIPFMLPAASAAVTDRIRSEIALLPGVFDVLVNFPTRNMSFTRTLNERIGAVRGSPGRAPTPAASPPAKIRTGRSALVPPVWEGDSCHPESPIQGGVPPVVAMAAPKM
jgi:DNA-binding Lrp family transcriptional regulator